MYPLSENMVPAWDDLTLMLYLLVALAAAAAAATPNLFLFNARHTRQKRFFEIICTVLSCAILVVFKAGCVGTNDVRKGYYANFVTATSMADYYDQTTEFGHRLLMVAVRAISSDYRLYLFVVALITIVPVCYGLWLIKDKVSMPASVFAFALVFMPMGMSAIRAGMAASLLFLSTIQYLRGKKGVSVVVFLIALSFHVGAIVGVLFLVFLELRNMRSIAIGLALLCTSALLLGIDLIGVLFQGRYSVYGINETMQGSGLGPFFKWFVPFILSALTLRQLEHKNRSDDEMLMPYCGFFSSFIGFEFEFLSYFISIAGRFEIFVVPLILIIGYWWKGLDIKMVNGFVGKVAIFGYVACMLYLRMCDCCISEALMPYVWGF